MSTIVPSMMQYRAAAIQYEPTLGEKEKNVADLLRLVEEAAMHGARLIVLPEIVASLGFGWVMGHLLNNNRLTAVIAGGFFMVVAALLMQRVVDAAEPVAAPERVLTAKPRTA